MTIVIIVGLFALLIGGSALLAAGIRPMEELRSLVIEWSNRRGLDPALVWGVVMTESSGNPAASNPSDPSTGLMGVTPLIGRAYANLPGTDVEVLLQLKNPAYNLQAGTGFLAHLQGRYADTFPLVTWIQSYNLGETKFDKGVRNPSYAERVLKHMAEWRG